MGKVNVQCLRLDIEPQEDFKFPEERFTDEKFAFRPAANGAESAIGLAVADPLEQSTIWPVLDGLMLRVQIESRKPAPKLVRAATRKKLKAQYGAFWTQQQESDAAAVTKAELWEKMDGEHKFVWVYLARDIILVFAKGPAVERMTAFLREILGSLPVRNYWAGHLYSEAVLDFIRDGKVAAKEGVMFTNDLTLKAGKKVVKLVDADDLRAEEVVHFTQQALKPAAAGMLVDEEHWALVSPQGSMSLEPVSAEPDEEELMEAENMWQFDCATQMLLVQHVRRLAARLYALTARYDKDKTVELPLP